MLFLCCRLNMVRHLGLSTKMRIIRLWLSFWATQAFNIKLFLGFFCNKTSTFFEHATFCICYFNSITVNVSVVIFSQDIVDVCRITLKMYVIAFYLNIKNHNWIHWNTKPTRLTKYIAGRSAILDNDYLIYQPFSSPHANAPALSRWLRSSMSILCTTN